MEIPRNENYREFLGICGLNSYFGTIASSRLQMFSSHIGQHVDIEGAMPPYHKTGMELEYGKTTFSIKMPARGVILKIFDMYPRLRQAKLNPISYVMYETISEEPHLNGAIGIFEVPKFGSQHQYFGYDYVPGPAISKLHPGAMVEEGEVFYQTKSVHPVTGEYMYGTQCNVAFMSHSGIAEDGIVISRAALHKFKFKTYHTRVIQWGSDSYPVAAYQQVAADGSIINKFFPDIGEYVREDGLLMAIRKLDDYHNITELDERGLSEINSLFDDCTYVNSTAGVARGRVIDIRVHHSPRSMPSNTPDGMDEQIGQYFQSRRQMLEDIYAEYRRLKREQGQRLKMTPKFRQRIREALSMYVGLDPKTTPNYPKGENIGGTEPIRIVHRKAPLDSWRVEFVIEMEVMPYVGCKLTGQFGDKGVICRIAEPEEMPVDADGNRAEIIMDGDSTVNRMNAGRLYQTYVNGSSRDLLKRVKRKLELSGIEMIPQSLEARIRHLDENTSIVKECWMEMASFYSIVSESMRQWATSQTRPVDYVKHIATMLLERAVGREFCEPLDVYIPPEDQVYLPSMIDQLEKNFPQCYGPVTFRSSTGAMVTTKEKVRISSMYILFLEKIADDWAAVSSGKVQHFGILSKVTNVDKYSTPTRESSTRTMGEAEGRLGVAYTEPWWVAELSDRNNNPNTHRNIYYNIVKAQNPSAIKVAVDRTAIPLNADKPGQLINHIGEIGGWRFASKKKAG